jgi:hypothetical protein
MKPIYFLPKVRFLYNIDLIERVGASQLIEDHFENLSILFSDIEFEIRELNTARG